MIKSPPLQNPSPAVAAAEPVIGVTAAPISAFRRFMPAVVVPPPAVVPPPPKVVPPRVIRTAEATVTDPYDEAEAMVTQAMRPLVATNSRWLQMAAHRHAATDDPNLRVSKEMFAPAVDIPPIGPAVATPKSYPTAKAVSMKKRAREPRSESGEVAEIASEREKHRAKASTDP